MTSGGTMNGGGGVMTGGRRRHDGQIPFRTWPR